MCLKCCYDPYCTYCLAAIISLDANNTLTLWPLPWMENKANKNTLQPPVTFVGDKIILLWAKMLHDSLLTFMFWQRRLWPHNIKVLFQHSRYQERYQNNVYGTEADGTEYSIMLNDDGKITCIRQCANKMSNMKGAVLLPNIRITFHWRFLYGKYDIICCSTRMINGVIYIYIYIYILWKNIW